MILALAAALAGCSERQRGPVVVSVVGRPVELAEPLKYPLSPAGKLILESTAQGLVAFDSTGEILPALAQRWIVQDDGLSYIFRLRRAAWPDGTLIEAHEVARLLKLRMAANRKLDPLGDLDAVEQVVPMTGEVIEIRLSTPRPYFLQMLAQPQMGITHTEGGTGPYRREQRPRALFLRPASDPNDRVDDRPPVLPRENRVLRAERAAKAIVRFREGLAALVLGGRFTDLPLLTKAGVDPRQVRADPVQGLFGLAIVGDHPFLDDDRVRAALSMAIDRSRLPGAFDLGGWAVTDRIVPQQLDMARPPADPGWHDMPIEERRTQARAAIDAWQGEEGRPVLRIALPAGSGGKVLFGLIASDLRQVGIATRQVALEADADLRLIDEVAAYDSALWYLGRISCARAVHCTQAGEEKLEEAGLTASLPERGQRLADAEALISAHNGYIPLAAPVRWALVAPQLNGFAPSLRGRHPLNHLFGRTN